tara:strand:- start:233384 stop:234436 length:1053 start_codon:yes stop_codon:yes gene_type:complete
MVNKMGRILGLGLGEYVENGFGFYSCRQVLTRFVLKFSWLFMFVFVVNSAYGACTGPAGINGSIQYSYTDNVLQFCDGANWIDMGNSAPLATGTACTSPASPEGSLEYNVTTNTYQFCNGDNWENVSGNTYVAAGSGGCSTPAHVESTIEYNTTLDIMQFCNGDTWIDALNAKLNYFVATSATFQGSALGGLSGANTKCETELTSRDWKGKPAGYPTGYTTKAWLCDNTTCNNLEANTEYTFAKAFSTTIGGATFTTDVNGTGPGNYDDWSDGDHFSNPIVYWTGKGAVGAHDRWNTTGASGYTCGNWASTSGSGYVGFPASSRTDRRRWGGITATCTNSNSLICMVNPN